MSSARSAQPQYIFKEVKEKSEKKLKLLISLAFKDFFGKRKLQLKFKIKELFGQRLAYLDTEAKNLILMKQKNIILGEMKELMYFHSRLEINKPLDPMRIDELPTIDGEVLNKRY